MIKIWALDVRPVYILGLFWDLGSGGPGSVGVLGSWGLGSGRVVWGPVLGDLLICSDPYAPYVHICMAYVMVCFLRRSGKSLCHKDLARSVAFFVVLVCKKWWFCKVQKNPGKSGEIWGDRIIYII